MNKLKKVAFHTLGCKLNFSETSTISRLFEENNFKRVEFNEIADIYIINTCSVTAQAESKCRNAINKVHRLSPNAFIAVIGCYAQLKPEEIVKIEGVDIVLGANEKFNLFSYINNLEKKIVPEIHSCEIDEVSSFLSAFSSNDRTRSFLKVQDGCDYECSYCTIPKARGKSRNESIEKTINIAKKAVLSGVKEIILAGVNIGDFGKSTNEKFIDLIRELDKINITRIRISSIEPNLLTDEILEFCNNSKAFLPHFHIPLQSGSNSILKLMKRRYNTNFYKEKIDLIKYINRQTAIGVDVIVGFPGETDELFEETYNFLNDLNISYLHVFSYSERSGTKSVEIKPKIQAKKIQERSKKLHILSDKKKRYFYEQNLNKIYNVLFEESSTSKIYGFTENYIKVEMDFDEKLINKIVQVRLKNINESGNVVVEIVKD
jgi:threonylcarbamoyladenosine tRNA methylthiotransferase MtaB